MHNLHERHYPRCSFHQTRRSQNQSIDVARIVTLRHRERIRPAAQLTCNMHRSERRYCKAISAHRQEQRWRNPFPEQPSRLHRRYGDAARRCSSGPKRSPRGTMTRFFIRKEFIGESVQSSFTVVSRMSSKRPEDICDRLFSKRPA